MRAGRPAAGTPLPPLNHQDHHAPAGPTLPNPIIAAANIAPVPIAMPREGSSPILPPRPTGRSVAVPRPSSPLRSWPVIVIGLAAVAIIAAVAIMVWPPSKPNRAAHDPHELQPPPAPERMDSDPLPDPSTQQHSQAEPPAPRHTPDPLPVQPAPRNIDPQDPFGSSPGGLSGLSPLNGIAGADMMMAVMGHACARLKSCPDADESVRDMCDMFSSYSRTAKAPDCDAARQCLEMIDKLDCSAAATPAALMTTIPSCLKAETSC
jgi:hypothetical protein